jgi:uncharacterized membrane protein
MDKEDWQIRIIQLLTLPGLLLAYYLLLFHDGALVAGCTGSGWDDCGAVSGPDAPYSSIGPVPVALVGLVGYALIFLTIWLSSWWPKLDDYLPELVLGLTGAALLFTVGLTGLEIFVIHAFCRFCIYSAIIIVIMFGLAVSYIRSA